MPEEPRLFQAMRMPVGTASWRVCDANLRRGSHDRRAGHGRAAMDKRKEREVG